MSHASDPHDLCGKTRIDDEAAHTLLHQLYCILCSAVARRAIGRHVLNLDSALIAEGTRASVEDFSTVSTSHHLHVDFELRLVPFDRRYEEVGRFCLALEGSSGDLTSAFVTDHGEAAEPKLISLQESGVDMGFDRHVAQLVHCLKLRRAYVWPSPSSTFRRRTRCDQ